MLQKFALEMLITPKTKLSALGYRLYLALVMVLLLVGCIPLEPVSAPQASTAPEAAVDAIAAEETVDAVAAEKDMATVVSAAELGTVDFPVSCNAQAQAEFNHSLTLLHSFWFPPAIESFGKVIELDPTCAMAYWGLAMAQLGIPWSPPPKEALAAGQSAVEQAVALGGATPREQAYIDAIAAFYHDADTLDHGTRALAYETAMEQLVEAYPDDTEAIVFYALALNITASPTDKTFANQLKAIDLVEPIFAAQPNHPGAAHYLIHSHDYPPLAEGGLEAALRYADIAPAAPHALHMPSHIFTRRGYWQESIETNQASAEATNGPALHAMDYMMYGHLQLAHDEAAKALVAELKAIKQAPGGLGSAYALAAMPARYVLERGAWAEGASLALYPPEFAWEKFPQAEAALVFARGLSAARRNDIAAAGEALAHLQTLQEALLAQNQAYWAGQVGIQREEIVAWMALAEGHDDQALTAMRHAVELEAATEKHPVTPGPILPAYELLGEMLLELDHPAEALQAFEASLQEDPHRFRGLYGAAQAAELAGDTAKAKAFYTELTKLVTTADSERPEVAQAQAFLAQQ